MRHLFLFLSLFVISANSIAQWGDCSKNAPKQFFSGVAPAPWAVDGLVNDWQTITGPFTGNVQVPFAPDPLYAFNYAFDGGIYDPIDPETPSPDQNFQFLSFMHDDHNVYFYFRRIANGTSPTSFYFFADVDGNGYMNEGEPVFYATIQDGNISHLRMGIYVPNQGNHYLPGYGNGMLPKYGFTFNPIPTTTPDPSDPLFNQYTAGIHNFPMQGTVDFLFDAGALPEKLEKNQVFKAALTENGFGVELAIPWTYLKNWSKTVKGKAHKPLKPGEIFFYKLSIQPDALPYNSASIVDNLGSCCRSLGKSGNVSFTNNGISHSVLVPNFKYQFRFSYTNNTNALTSFDIEHVEIDSIIANNGMTVDPQQFQLKLYRDLNCNGVIDFGEKEFPYYTNQLAPVQAYGDIRFEHYSNPAPIPNTQILANATAPAYGNACFIAELTLPLDGSVKTAKVIFKPSVLFKLPWEYCDAAGGKAVNQVGFVEQPVGDDDNVIPQQKEINEPAIYLYPNPTNGSTTIILPKGTSQAEIVIEDGFGRQVRKIKANNQQVQVSGLRRGVYVVKVILPGGKQFAKKLLVN